MGLEKYRILLLLHFIYQFCESDVFDSSQSSCETIGGDKCVFPFTYQRQTYYACTAADSDNGAPWCAVQVRSDPNRTVLQGKWEDCSPGCPGYDLSENFCRSNSQCEMKLAGSVCQLYTGECHCPEDAPIKLESRCVSVSKYDENCDDDLQCQHYDSNTWCSTDGFCHCKVPFIRASNHCVKAKVVEKTEEHFTFSFFFLIIPILVVLVLTILSLRLVSIFLIGQQKKCAEESEQIENREVRIETQDDDSENKLKTDDVTESDSEIKIVEEDQEVVKFQKIVRRGQGGLYFEEYLV